MGQTSGMTDGMEDWVIIVWTGWRRKWGWGFGTLLSVVREKQCCVQLEGRRLLSGLQVEERKCVLQRTGKQRNPWACKVTSPSFSLNVEQDITWETGMVEGSTLHTGILLRNNLLALETLRCCCGLTLTGN